MSSWSWAFARKKIENNRQNIAALIAHHGITATAANSRRPATKQVPRASPRSPAFVETSYVEIDQLNLSLSMIVRKGTDGTQHREINRRL